MERFEYSVVTRAPRCLAWQIFSDWRRWPRFSEGYGDIRWVKGSPWQAGSRLLIDVLHPVRATVDHVITVCSPPEFVAWIDHALGNSMEQWVTFHDLGDGGTRIHTWAEIAGPTRHVDGLDVHDVVRAFIHQWYEAFRMECDQVAEQNSVCI